MNATIQAAQNACRKFGSSFEKEVALYLDNGYVVSQPGKLMLFRAVRTECPNAWLTDPKEGNAWFVHLAVGPGGVAWFFKQQPWTLPFLIWCRGCRGDFRPHIYLTEAFRKHI